MATRNTAKGSITLVEVILAGAFMLGLGITVVVMTNMARERAHDRDVALQLLGEYGINVTFNDEDRPTRAVANGRTLSAEAVALLLQLESLEYLNLNHCQTVSQQLAALQGLPNLQHLCLVATDVDDGALPAVAALPELRWLDLRRTNISNAGVSALTDCKKLVQLNLDEALVTDGVADTVARIPTLQRVALRLTRITNPELVRLGNVPHLRQLDVGGALVTHDALDELRRTRPDLQLRSTVPNRIGSFTASRRKWAEQELKRLGVQIERGSTVIPERAGDTAAFPLMYCRAGMLDGSGSGMTDACVPMLLMGTATGIDLGGTHVHWKVHGTADMRNYWLRSVLNLAGTRIDDSTFEDAASPFPARQIILSNTSLGDLGVQRLANRKSQFKAYWTSLSLDGTNITDAAEPSLDTLLRLPSVRQMNLRRTAVSQAVISRLRSDHPQVTIQSAPL